jgi:hypothetical protein
MARSSNGPNRAATWAVTQKPKPRPHVVRLGRPANDNYRPHGALTRLLKLGVATALLALFVWWVI